MRILHTSDWHLGRSLHGVDLLPFQRTVLEHLEQLVEGHAVDVLLVAGDIYDRAIPPVEAVTLLSESLGRLAARTRVILAPGNHDSAIRLGFGAAMLREGIDIRADLTRVGEPVVVDDEHGPVAFYPLPYLDPDTARGVLGSTDAPLARSHAAVMGAALERVRADLTARRQEQPVRSVVAAHAFVIGGLASDSERDIRIGGVDAVPAQLFDGFDYVALGHLHGAQHVGAASGVERMRYSGSPLAYSFSERNQVKSSVLVDLGADGSVELQLLPAPVPRRLVDVTGTLAELEGPAGDSATDAWVRATVTDDVRPPELYAALSRRFPHLLVWSHAPANRSEDARAAAVTAISDPVEVTAEFIEYATGAPATPRERELIAAANEAALAMEGSA
ncbi:exonuclease SbcCD subunit D [Plantibacter sp. LMC-P-059a]|uniref:exonuclease SbcCD subunit D n=1 Tax=Plantibacter sp. LMC-P-059a TaxID=3040297 RepID=UPI00254D0988|nr:exonuclease SbcCD subunit D [Plantibacter sp. LMC-P-059a]